MVWRASACVCSRGRLLDRGLPRALRSGRLKGCRAVSRDPTAGSESWPALPRNPESEDAVLRAAFDGAGVAACLCTPDGTFLRVNRALCELVGHDAPALLGRRLRDLAHAQDAARCDSQLSALCSEGAACRRIPLRLLHRDGKEVWTEVILSVVSDGTEAGPLLAAHLLPQNTDGSRGPLAAGSEDAAIGLLSAISEVALLLDPDLRVLAASGGLADRLGVPLNALVGQPVLALLPPEVAAHRGKYAEQVLATGQPAYFEDRNQGRDYANTVLPILDAEGRVGYLAVVCRDVTAQREAERRAAERAHLLDSILAAVPVGISCIRDRVPLWTNAAMETLSGRLVDEHVGAITRALYVDEEEFRRVGEALYGAACGTAETDTTWRRPDGSTVHVHLQATPLAPGDPSQGYIVTAVDLSERLRGEQILRSALERYRGLYDAMPGGVMVCRADGVVLDANDTACQLLGVPYERLVGWPMPIRRWHILAADGTPWPIDRLTDNLEWLLQHRVRNLVIGLLQDPASAECTWLLVNSEPRIAPATGEQEAVVITLMDITDQKRSEMALRESEERFRTAFENAPVGVSLTSVDGTLLRVNRAFCQMLGYTEQELVGTNVTAITYPEDAALTRDWIRAMPTSGPWALETEKRYLHRDGSTVWAVMNTTLLRDATGRPLHFVTHVVDITERKRAQQALEESERRFREMADLLPDAVFELNRELRITYANRAFYRVLGCTPADVAAGLDLASRMDVETRDRMRRDLEQMAEAGRTVMGVYNLKRMDGAVVPTEVHAMAVVGPDGELTGYRAVLRDLTDRRKAEDAQRLASLGQLAAGVGHEFNNLLGVLLLQAELAAPRLKQGPGACLVQTALSVAAHGRDLCKNLATFARPDEPHRELLSVEEVVDAGLSLAAAQIASSGIAVTRDYQSRGQLVHADARQLEQVLLNILLNACHAMPKGGVLTVSTRHVPGAGDPGHVVIAVRDTGTGIHPDHLPRIFEPFFTTKGRLGESEVAGSGLGLSVSHGIVKAHGGEIRVHSSLGVGSTFEVVLPVAAPPAPEETAPEACAPPAPAAPARVLVAEDSELMAELMHTVLTGAGHTVDCVQTTAQAVAALHANHYDLIITDMLMPGGGGREVLRQVQKLASPPSVLVITGLTDVRFDSEALALGAAAVVHKPVAVRQLMEAVETLLQTRRNHHGG